MSVSQQSTRWHRRRLNVGPASPALAVLLTGRVTTMSRVGPHTIHRPNVGLMLAHRMLSLFLAAHARRKFTTISRQLIVHIAWLVGSIIFIKFSLSGSNHANYSVYLNSYSNQRFSALYLLYSWYFVQAAVFQLCQWGLLPRFFI